VPCFKIPENHFAAKFGAKAAEVGPIPSEDSRSTSGPDRALLRRPANVAPAGKVPHRRFALCAPQAQPPYFFAAAGKSNRRPPPFPHLVCGESAVCPHLRSGTETETTVTWI